MDMEVAPVLGELEGIDLETYQDTLLKRFGNPSIKDVLSRICLESSSKLTSIERRSGLNETSSGARLTHLKLFRGRFFPETGSCTVASAAPKCGPRKFWGIG
ncbi:hypothetical protein [Rhodopirellula bahusiensis]|uniref:mannitol dehydrogenase family protein n=1 Tax=Rhodopirellula bahusiensis TaxID=2014065 RepID=UPI003D654A1A